MRIVQLIDSLEAGGAERMAVNYANALGSKIAFSGLVVSRKEGTLLEKLDENIAYSFLNKTHTFDIKALLVFRRYIKNNKVEIIHSHSTSFFLAFLLKILLPKLRLIWHDHYGDSEFLCKRPSFILKIVSRFFDGIIVVNTNLEVWSKEILKFKNVIYLPNFPNLENEIETKTVLKGTDNKRILNLANLRPQKNHFLLLEIAKKLKISNPEWTFHLVGKDFNDDYSLKIKKAILDNGLQNHVFYYGSKKDIANIINQCQIGILTSSSEGLPLALLEYGIQKKPVVATNVGEISKIILNSVNGFIVAPNDVDIFYNNLIKLIQDKGIASQMGVALYQTILNNYSEKAVIQEYIDWLKKKSTLMLTKHKM